MIPSSATLSIQRLPLSSLRIFEYQPRYTDRLLHYIDLLRDPANADKAPGLVCVKPLGDGTYETLDGHHRLCAHIMTGRGEVLCVVIDERGS